MLTRYLATHLVGMPATYGYGEDIGEVKWLKAHEWGKRKTPLGREMETAEYFDIFENSVMIMSVVGKRYGADLAGTDHDHYIAPFNPHVLWCGALSVLR